VTRTLVRLCPLRNVGPRADGVTPQRVRDWPPGTGCWLTIDGEAVHDTRPWIKSKYAIIMDWPDDQAVVKSLSTSQRGGGQVHSVGLLRHKGALEQSRENQGLSVRLPVTGLCEHALAQRIICDEP